MKIQKTFSSFSRFARNGFLFGAMFGAFYAPLPAQAQAPELQFRPTQAWEAGTETANTAGECRIKTEFNNGFVMQFNGASNWVQQLNINFRQNVFEIGKAYRVDLSIPGTLNKTFDATAYRPNILSIVLKGEKEFYKALRPAAVLDFKMDTNDFRFYLTGFGNAAAAFEKCLAGQSVNNLAQAQSAAPRPPVSVNDPDNLKKPPQPDFLTNESIALEQKETQKVAITEIIPENIEPVIEEIQSKPTNPAIDRVERKLAVPPALPPAIPTPAAPAPKPEPAVQKTADLLPPPIPREPVKQDPVVKAEEAKAEPMIAKFTPEEEPAPIEPAPEPSPEPEPAPAPKTISHKTPPIKVNKEITRKEADFTTIEPAHAKAKRRNNDGLIARISVLEKEIQSLRGENENLNEELNATLKEGEQERLSIASENWNLERATKQFNEAERQIKRLGQQLQKERAQCSFEKKELETLLFDPEVTQEAQLARLSTLEQELAAAKRKIKSLENQSRSQ